MKIIVVHNISLIARRCDKQPFLMVDKEAELDKGFLQSCWLGSNLCSTLLVFQCQFCHSFKVLPGMSLHAMGV